MPSPYDITKPPDDPDGKYAQKRLDHFTDHPPTIADGIALMQQAAEQAVAKGQGGLAGQLYKTIIQAERERFIMADRLGEVLPRASLIAFANALVAAVTDEIKLGLPNTPQREKELLTDRVIARVLATVKHAKPPQLEGPKE
jgi:hypothetical protein